VCDLSAVIKIVRATIKYIYNFCTRGTKGDKRGQDICILYNIIAAGPRTRKIVFYTCTPLLPQIVTRENNENFGGGGSFPRQRLPRARSITHALTLTIAHSPTLLCVNARTNISSRSLPPESLGLWLIDLPTARNQPEFHHRKIRRLFLSVYRYNSYGAAGYYRRREESLPM